VCGESDHRRAVNYTITPFTRADEDDILGHGPGGDCLAYACAAAAGDTLLFVGDDFKRTDIPPA
jgi:hypothetical protein